jgi:hypothetical protein
MSAWTLAAFAIGAFAGIRCAVPAIAVTLAAYTGLVLAAMNFLRPYCPAPLVTRNLFNPPGSVLALPVDRGRLAARVVIAARRRDRVAGPPPADLNRLRVWRD